MYMYIRYNVLTVRLFDKMVQLLVIWMVNTIWKYYIVKEIIWVCQYAIARDWQ